MKYISLKKNIQKGLGFATMMIFFVLTGFQVIAATIVSKLFGDQVLRGGIPATLFMLIVHILFGFWVGWSAGKSDERGLKRILNGFVSGLATGLAIALFDLILYFLLQSEIDVREYLSAMSLENMSFFLLDKGQMGILIHLLVYTAAGLAGSAATVFFSSNLIKGLKKNIKQVFTNLGSGFKSKLPPFILKFGKFFIYALLLAVLFFMPISWGSYWNYVIGAVGLFIIAGIGLNIIVGLSGQLVLGYAAFFAMGAYSVALLNAPEPHNIMLGFWPSLLVGIVMAVLAAVVLGLPIMRLRGDYLAIVTLGFGEIIRILLKSDLLADFTGGPRGIHDIHGPTLFGQPFSSDSDYVYIIFLGVLLAIFLYNRLQNSRAGRAWLAIKGDAIAAQATGVNLQKYKLLALCLGAAFAGLAGGIFSARNQFTGPNDHAMMVSMNILSIVIVGGVNSIPGIILGAFTLKGLPEILREVENYRQLVFGALLVVMMLSRPNGLWPSSRPLIEAHHNAHEGKNSSQEGVKDA